MPAASDVIARLERVNRSTNDGQGSSVCRAVIVELRRGDIAAAMRVASLDFDKVRQYPELAQLFRDVGLIDTRRT